MVVFKVIGFESDQEAIQLVGAEDTLATMITTFWCVLSEHPCDGGVQSDGV